MIKEISSDNSGKTTKGEPMVRPLL